MAAPTPSNEVKRLRALAEYDVLDTSPEAAYDDLTALAAQICDVPISLLTLVDSDRQWFKSRIGLERAETPRDHSFCAWAVSDGMPLEVEDALTDERFAANPLVTGDPNIRFYAGAPLVTEEGLALGTLCVIDRQPRRLTEAQASALQSLARAAMAQLDLRRQNDQLRALDRMKEEFVAVVSHELRTPLASVVGYLEELRNEANGPLNDTQLRFLDVVDRNADRLLSLVNDLLFLAQLEAGSAGLSIETVDLAAIAAEAVDSCRLAAAEKGVEIVFDAPAAVELRGDGRRLSQVADNLLSNAVKFTPAGGTVVVRLVAGDPTVTLSVSDTGVGIAADELAHLFGRFYRTRAAASAAIPGTGLGLAITRGIVEAHGGTIGVESASGEGTTFTVSIPRGE